MRRSFLFLAAGLLATVAFASPSQAGSIITGVADFTIITPSTATATNVELTFSPGVLGSASDFSLPAGVTETIAGNVLSLHFAATGTENISFTFDSAAAPADVTLTASLALSGLNKPVTLVSTVAGVSAVSSVPEPASVALLGVGMAGFFAFRRMFKRSATA